MWRLLWRIGIHLPIMFIPIGNILVVLAREFTPVPTGWGRDVIQFNGFHLMRDPVDTCEKRINVMRCCCGITG